MDPWRLYRPAIQPLGGSGPALCPDFNGAVVSSTPESPQQSAASLDPFPSLRTPEAGGYSEEQPPASRYGLPCREGRPAGFSAVAVQDGNPVSA